MTVNFGMVNPYLMNNFMDAPLLNPYSGMGTGYGMVGGFAGITPQQQMQTMVAKRDTLLPRIMSGEVKVTEH